MLDFFISTLSLTIEYKKPIPKDLQWAMVRTHTNIVRNGRCDVDIYILDTKREVIALARQVCLLHPIQKAITKTNSKL